MTATVASLLAVVTATGLASAQVDDSHLSHPRFASADFQVAGDCVVIDGAVRAVQGTLLKNGLRGAPTSWSDVTVILWIHNPDPESCDTPELELSGWAPGPFAFEDMVAASVDDFAVHITDATGSLAADAVVDLRWTATTRQRTTFVNHDVPTRWFESINVVGASVEGTLVFTNGGGVVPDAFTMTGENATFAELGKAQVVAIGATSHP
ncbi:MAG: hypothetical protein AB1736_08085 [Chloroflexota bacterium]